MEINAEIISKNTSPIIEGEQVCFIFNGDAQAVYLTGDYNCWQVEDSMTRFKDGNVWYINKNFPGNARFDYKFVVDGNWIIDPLNSNTSVVGPSTNSTLVMPEYKSEYDNIIAGVSPEGSLINDLKFNSAYMNTEMTYHIYLPYDYKKDEVRHIIYTLDGSDYANYAKINRILDHMISAGEIPKLAAVLIDTKDRSRDLTLYRPYYNYIVKELMPHVESEYMPESFERSVAGVSWGGLTAFYLAANRPYRFRGGLSQSGSYWPKDWKIFDMVAKAPVPDIRFVLQTGTIQDTEEMNDMMAELLAKKGCNIHYVKYAETHSWYNWRGHLNEGLKELFV